MNRETAKKNLQSIGIEEPTDEQISNYLNQMNGEVKSYKDKVDQYKAKADTADGLQAQIDALNEQNMTDVDKANAATQKANQQIEELQKELATMKLAKSLSDKGIIGDDATKIIEAINNGDFSAMVESFGNVIATRETQSASAKEQELLMKTGNPNGKIGDDGNELTTAEQIVSSLISGNKASEGANNALSHYINS